MWKLTEQKLSSLSQPGAQLRPVSAGQPSFWQHSAPTVYIYDGAATIYVLSPLSVDTGSHMCALGADYSEYFNGSPALRPCTFTLRACERLFTAAAANVDETSTSALAQHLTTIHFSPGAERGLGLIYFC